MTNAGKFFSGALIAAAALLAAAGIVMLRHGAESWRRPGLDSIDAQRLCRMVDADLASYEAEVARLEAQIIRELPDRTAPYFDQGRSGVAVVADNCSKWTYLFRLSRLMLLDDLDGGDRLEQAMLVEILPLVALPCLDGIRVARTLEAEFELELRAAENRFLAELLSHGLPVENLAGDGEAESRLAAEIAAGAGLVAAGSRNAAGAAFGTAVEAAFLRSSMAAVRRLLAGGAAKMGGGVGAGAMAAAADGPLPVGDVAGGVLAAGGIIWAAWDLAGIEDGVHAALERTLRGAVDSCRCAVVNEVIGRSGELTRRFLRRGRRIALERKEELAKP